jgi:hypothetical protein
MRIGSDRHANLAVVPIEPQEGAALVVTGPVVTGPVVTGPVVTGPVVTGPVVTGPVVTGPVELGQVEPGPVLAELAVASVTVAQVVADMVAIDLWGIVPKETDLHDDRVLLAQKVQAIANDQREVDDPQERVDTAKGPKETVLQVQGDAQIDRVAVVLAMPELHLELKGVQSRPQHAAGCEEQDPLQETLHDPQKEATGREAAVPEWVVLEAVAVNVPLALELEVVAEAVLDDLVAVVRVPVLPARVHRDQVLRDQGHHEAVPQEPVVLDQRVQVDLAEVENLVAIEVGRCSG